MRHSLWNGNSDRQCAAQTTVFATKKPTAIGFQTGSGQTGIGSNPAFRSDLPSKPCKTLLQNRNQSQHVYARIRPARPTKRKKSYAKSFVTTPNQGPVPNAAANWHRGRNGSAQPSWNGLARRYWNRVAEPFRWKSFSYAKGHRPPLGKRHAWTK